MHHQVDFNVRIPSLYSHVQIVTDLRSTDAIGHGDLMPFCRKCGFEVSPQQKFCPKCGTNLDRSMFPASYLLKDSGNETKYSVFVDDNFHYMDEEERYKLGDFSSYEEAVEACKRIVDEFLESAYKKGVSFEELYRGYIGFGEDPFVVPDDRVNHFSAWDYAKARCRELCSK